MVNIGKRIRDAFTRSVLNADLGGAGKFEAFGVRLLQLLYVAIAAFFDEQLTLWTMSLVYTTILSLIPLLAVSFSLVKAFDSEINMAEIVSNALTPLGPAGIDLAQRTASTVEKIDVGLLGAVGFLFLFYKAISLISKIERALNYIWRADSAGNTLRRFGYYMIVLIIGPILIFAAIGITFSLMSTAAVQWLFSIKLLGPLIHGAGTLIPYAIVSAVFTFTYMLLPAAGVRFSSALVGGLFAGAAWEAAGWAFAAFTVTSAQYSIVYSGFAIPILFLLWLYLSWFVLLVGGEISFYHQNPGLLARATHRPRASGQDVRLSLAVMFLIGSHFYDGKQPWTPASLAQRLGAGAETIRDVLDRLEKNGVVAATREEPPHYLPAGALNTIGLKRVVQTGAPGTTEPDRRDSFDPPIPEVEAAMEQLDKAVIDFLADSTVEDLVLSESAERAAKS
jgi:membrane protein